MTALKFTGCAIRADDRGVWISLLLDKADATSARRFVMERKDKIYTAELKEYREERSLGANAYYWKLCGDLAKATGETTDNIYLRHITLCMAKEAVPDFERQWKSGHLGRLIETRKSKIPGCTTVLAYYGSSDFDTREMSRLIDNCIQDCRAVGVEALPPDKLASLKEEWGNG